MLSSSREKWDNVFYLFGVPDIKYPHKEDEDMVVIYDAWML
jgi:hypothetical protein